jgi:hypothetical protein
MTGRAFGDALQKERDKGKRTALADVEKRAKAAGFENIDALFATVANLTKAGAGQQPPPPTNQPPVNKPNDNDTRPQPPANRHDRKAMARYERDLDAFKRKLDVADRARRVEEKRRRELQQKLDATEARAALEKVAISKGIKDVDYAVSLLTRHLEDKPEAELKAFDEGKYFEELRTTHPYLFGEVVVPATTGIGNGNVPAPPRPGPAAAAVATNGQVDATKMSKLDYEAHLRKRGINPNAVS